MVGLRSFCINLYDVGSSLLFETIFRSQESCIIRKSINNIWSISLTGFFAPSTRKEIHLLDKMLMKNIHLIVVYAFMLVQSFVHFPTFWMSNNNVQFISVLQDCVINWRDFFNAIFIRKLSRIFLLGIEIVGNSSCIAEALQIWGLLLLLLPQMKISWHFSQFPSRISRRKFHFLDIFERLFFQGSCMQLRQPNWNHFNFLTLFITNCCLH